MDVYSLIKQRRSIRQYVPGKDIPADMLERVLDAGAWAPSGKNFQNWRFYILKGEKLEEYLSLSQKSWLVIRESLERRLKPSLYKFTERFFYTLGQAPILVLAFAEVDAAENEQTQIGNVYLAIQNMVLAAQQEGLGTCILGSPLRVEAEVRKYLGLENEPSLRLVCGLTLGFPAHEPPAPPRQLAGRFIWF